MPLRREQIVEAMARAALARRQFRVFEEGRGPEFSPWEAWGERAQSEAIDAADAALSAAIPRLILAILNAHASHPTMQSADNEFWLALGFEKASEAIERFRIPEQAP
jgi:hypothetical protein